MLIANPETPPLVTIIVVNWNTRALLSACLDSIRTTVRDVSYQIVVVDNASTDGSAEWLRASQGDIAIIQNPENIGFAHANNQALALCRGSFALLLNSDARLKDGTLARLLDLMREETNAAAVAPMLVNPDDSFQAGPNDDLTLWNETLLMLGLARLFRKGHYPGYDANAPRGEYAWVGGTCLLLRRAAWEQIGILDPDYFMYTEEADWCWRARQAGWKIWYEPAAQTIHLGGGSSRQAAALMRAALYKSKLIFFRKNRPRWQSFVLRNMLLGTASAKAMAYGIIGRMNRVRAARWNERALSFRLVVDALKTVTA